MNHQYVKLMYKIIATKRAKQKNEIHRNNENG